MCLFVQSPGFVTVLLNGHEWYVWQGNNEEKKYQVDQGVNAGPPNNEVMTTGKSDMPMMPSNHDSAMV